MAILQRLATAAILVFFLTPALPAQTPTFEIRGGAVTPSTPLLDIDERTRFGEDNGTGWMASVSLPILHQVALEAGFSRQVFPCEPNCQLASAGFQTGLRGELNLGLPVRPWAAGGLLFHSLTLRHTPATQAELLWIVADTEPGTHFGAGISLGLGRSLELTPGVRFNRYTTRLRPIDEDGIPGQEIDRAVQFVVIDLGIRFRP